jgi:hypothetical protein
MDATIDHAALVKCERHEASKTVMAGLNVDSEGKRIGGLERRLGRCEQKWSCERGFLTEVGSPIARFEVVVEARRWH